MPEYGLERSRAGLLPWRWAADRLARAHNYWIATTGGDGAPHLVAVWGIWLDDTFLFSTAASSRKGRNLAANPRCVISTERADEAVIVQGDARLVTDRRRLARIARIYDKKYGSGFPAESHVYAVRPRVAFGFIEREEDFGRTATRWRFSQLSDASGSPRHTPP